jgi:hypothetical protein
MLWRAGDRKARLKVRRPIKMNEEYYEVDGKWFDPLGIRGEYKGNDYATLRV